MVFTRNAHRLDSRALRSRRVPSLRQTVLLSQPTSSPHPFRSRTARGKSQRVAVVDRQNGSTSIRPQRGLEEPKQTADGLHAALSVGRTGLCLPSTMESHKAENRLETITEPYFLPSMDGATAAESPWDQALNQTSHAQQIQPADLEDVGLPHDQLWDQDKAYDRRFCFEHGEFEYLLGTPNRWMSPIDFGTRGAESRLTRLLQDQSTATFDPHSRRCQAECDGNLLSHVHHVLEQKNFNGSTLYLIRWKASWTPEGCIDDKSWLAVSLADNRNKQRRSNRLMATSVGRESKYKEMMMVVNIA